MVRSINFEDPEHLHCKMARFSYGIIWITLALTLCSVDGETIALTDSNVDSVLNGNDIVLINFYADWCRFSQILKPTFEEAGKKVKEEIPTPGKITFASVDCDREVNIASRFRINKYPTLKLFRNGNAVKKEYRGQRSVEALVQFAHSEVKDPVSEITHLDNLSELDTSQRHVIAYFESKDSSNYINFAKVASILRDECKFHAAFGPVSQGVRQLGDSIHYRPPSVESSIQDDMVFSGKPDAFTELFSWTVEKCLPLVREITFENAEELTEEGLPFLILFHDPKDTASVEMFRREVSNQIVHEKPNINFLIADGLKFAHPLHHLGKSTNDLPILAIDSFRHMYLFPHDVKTGLSTPGLLKRFIEDLHSGKLHREFHHGPDPATEAPPPAIDSDQKNIPRDTSSDSKPPSGRKITAPPESTFKKLAPSRNRYTILRDEL